MNTAHHHILSQLEILERKRDWVKKLVSLQKNVADLQAEALRRAKHVEQIQTAAAECAEFDTSIRYFVNKIQFDNFKMAVPVREVGCKSHPTSLSDVQLWHEFHDLLVQYRMVNSSLERLMDK